MNIEELPKFITFNEKAYSLAVYPTAWGKLCLCYKIIEPKEDSRIFSQVVEKDVDWVQVDYNFNRAENDKIEVDEIVDVFDFNEAVQMCNKRIEKAIYSNKVEII